MAWDLLSLALVAILGALLLAAGLEDVRNRLISNGKTLLIAALAPVWWWAAGVASWPFVAIQIAVAATVFGVFCGAYALGWMGGGDVKLIGALALWLPLSPLVAMLMAMALAGGAVTLAMLVELRMRRAANMTQVPDGPATAVEVPYGVAIAIAGLLALREPLLNQFT